MAIAALRVGVVRPACMPKGLRNPLYWSVGERLRALGIAYDLTQTQIADAAGISQTTISRIEHRDHAPRIDIVERLASVLGISPTWLAFGDQGHKRWNQRHPRSPLPPDLPVPDLARREAAALYKGMGTRLKQAREARMFTLRALSPVIEDKWGYLEEEKKTISRQTILLLEAGRTVPLVKTCEAIALALDVSPGWLAYGEGEGPDLHVRGDSK